MDVEDVRSLNVEAVHPLYITRQEFYQTVGLALIFVGSAELRNAESARLGWSGVMLALVPFVLGMCCMFRSYWDTKASRERLKHLRIAPPSERVQEIARDPKRRIEAIRVYREETGAGLAEAKHAVETYFQGLRV